MSRPGALHRITVWLAAMLCLLFIGTLRDTPDGWLSQQGAPPLPPGSMPRGGDLRVEVSEEAGGPASGVTVRAFAVVTGAVYLAGRAQTDGDGSVTLAKVPMGEIWLLTERAGLARTSKKLIMGPNDRTVKMQLAAAQSFEVVVVDPLQRPIRGVKVSLHGSDPLAFHGYTSARGLARFEGLGPPPYAVDVTAQGFESKFFPQLESEDSPLFVKLSRLGQLEVTVLKIDGTPAPAAKVMVSGASLWPARSATTDNIGKVRIAGLHGGYFELRAEDGEWVSMDAGVMLREGETKEVTLQLQAGRFITVLVTDGPADNAAPVPRAEVTLAEGGLSSFPRYSRTDSQGRARLGPMLADLATVSAWAEGFVAKSAVALEEDQDELRIALLRGGTIRGRVVDERDFPIEGATLEVLGMAENGVPLLESQALRHFSRGHFASALGGASPLVPAGELGVMRVVPGIPRELGGDAMPISPTSPAGTPWASGRDGSFTLTPVTPGEVQVLVHHPNYVDALSKRATLTSDGDLEMTIVMHQGGLLEGRVVDHDGTAASGARIEISASETSRTRITYTAEDGSFALTALPKQVRLTVARREAPEHVVTSLELDLKAGETTEVEITLPEPRDPVGISVADDRGYPLARAELQITSLDPKLPLQKTLFSDDAGEVTLPDGLGMPLRVIARRRGYGPSVSQFESAPSSITIKLQPAITATGSVESTHAMLAGAELVLLTPVGAQRARTDEHGDFRFEDLAPGTGRLLVTAEGFVPDERIVVLAFEQRDADFGRIELRAAGIARGIVVDEEGEPIRGARVAAGRVPTYLPIGRVPLGISVTGRDGRFVLRGLPAGDTPIEAFKLGRGRAAVDAQIRAGDAAEGLRIEIVADPDFAARRQSRASLAVTLSEEVVDGKRSVVFAYVPWGGAAQRAGILSGDRFISYNGKAIGSLEQARRSLNGPLSRDFVVELTRDPDLRWKVRVQRERLRR